MKATKTTKTIKSPKYTSEEAVARENKVIVLAVMFEQINKLDMLTDADRASVVKLYANLAAHIGQRTESGTTKLSDMHFFKDWEKTK